MRVCHNISTVFDDPNLISHGGLPAMMELAEQAGLHGLVAEHVRVPGTAGANAAVKVSAVVAGMVTGADSISDLDVLRHGGMGRIFDGIRAATTLGTHLRGYTFGHIRQLDAVASRFLTSLAGCSPILSGADQIVFVDVDDTIRETHGYQKQGAAYGYSRVKGLNAQLAVITTPLSAPMIGGARLRKGNSASAHGADRLITDTLATLRRAVPGAALVVVRADSAYFNRDTIHAAIRGGARFSITAKMNPAVTKAIAAIKEDAWEAIQYPNAIFDQEQQRWISDAEVAEIEFTAFQSPVADRVTARLIVRRVKRLNPRHQDELLPGWRHHGVFTNNPMPLLQAEACHRDHALVEQVIADLKDGALAHAPSGKFLANAAWLVMATMAFNLTRAAATLASETLGRARTATIRRTLINVAARVANTARRWILHLPRDWPWQPQLENLIERLHPPPIPATT